MSFNRLELLTPSLPCCPGGQRRQLLATGRKDPPHFRRPWAWGSLRPVATTGLRKCSTS
jgi:hypothetical protein